MNQTELSQSHEIEIRKSIDEIITQIHFFYARLVDDIPIEDFMLRYIAIKHDVISKSCSILVAGDYHNEREVQIGVTYLVLRYIETATSKSLPKKDYVEAWKNISEARYWSGFIFGLYNIHKDIEGSVRLSRAEVAKKGGQEKAQKLHGDLKAEVCRLFVEERFIPWRSARAAAIKIYSAIKENNSSIATLKNEQATTTVSSWIKKIPNYKEYVKTPKNKKQSEEIAKN